MMHEAEDINTYGIVSILLFFGFFTGMLVWALGLKKNHLNHMGSLPLDGGEKEAPDKIQSGTL